MAKKNGNRNNGNWNALLLKMNCYGCDEKKSERTNQMFITSLGRFLLSLLFWSFCAEHCYFSCTLCFCWTPKSFFFFALSFKPFRYSRSETISRLTFRFWCTSVCVLNVQVWMFVILIGCTYSGKSPSTRHIYCFCTWRFRIWCSIWRAFFGLRPNNKRPDVRRSKRWIVRKFFKLNSLANMKTTVLWRYRPHGCT